MLDLNLSLVSKTGYWAFEAKDQTTGKYQEVFIRETKEELLDIAKTPLTDHTGSVLKDEFGETIFLISPFTYKE